MSYLDEIDQEIVEQLAMGKRYEEIADKLYLSEKAVRNRLYRVRNQYNLDTTTQLVAVAVDEGWIDL